MGVRTIPNVILWRGRSLLERNVLSAGTLCWKKETSWYVQIRLADTQKKNSKHVNVKTIRIFTFSC